MYCLEPKITDNVEANDTNLQSTCQRYYLPFQLNTLNSD